MSTQFKVGDRVMRDPRHKSFRSTSPDTMSTKGTVNFLWYSSQVDVNWDNTNRVYTYSTDQLIAITDPPNTMEPPKIEPKYNPKYKEGDKVWRNHIEYSIVCLCKKQSDIIGSPKYLVERVDGKGVYLNTYKLYLSPEEWAWAEGYYHDVLMDGGTDSFWMIAEKDITSDRPIDKPTVKTACCEPTKSKFTVGEWVNCSCMSEGKIAKYLGYDREQHGEPFHRVESVSGYKHSVPEYTLSSIDYKVGMWIYSTVSLVVKQIKEIKGNHLYFTDGSNVNKSFVRPASAKEEEKATKNLTLPIIKPIKKESKFRINSWVWYEGITGKLFPALVKEQKDDNYYLLEGVGCSVPYHIHKDLIHEIKYEKGMYVSYVYGIRVRFTGKITEVSSSGTIKGIASTGGNFNLSTGSNDVRPSTGQEIKEFESKTSNKSNLTSNNNLTTKTNNYDNEQQKHSESCINNISEICRPSVSISTAERSTGNIISGGKVTPIIAIGHLSK